VPARLECDRDLNVRTDRQRRFLEGEARAVNDRSRRGRDAGLHAGGDARIFRITSIPRAISPNPSHTFPLIVRLVPPGATKPSGALLFQ